MGKTWEYTYDAWGNCTQTLLNISGTNSYARDNPFRYRGYYLDTETGLYYLQSRYYDPAIGRFINPDGTEYLGANGDLISFNLYAYCSNNPVMGYDPMGNWDWELTGKIALTVVVVGACLTGVGMIAASVVGATTATVALAVGAAGVTTVLNAADGAICAEESGGNWYDGLMAGAIGGSVGALISNFALPGSDTSFRLNVLSRTVSSLTYDLVYDAFSGKQFEAYDVARYVIDVGMDSIYSTITYYYTGGISNGFLQSGINGFSDGCVDVFQTIVHFP